VNEEALTSTTGVYKNIDKLEGKKLPVVKTPLNFPDLTGWGV